MAAPTLLPGNRFRLLRSAGGTPETFTFVCLATTLEVTRGNDYEDATVPDCATPTSIPWRKSVVRSKNWSIRFSGTVDASRMANFRTDVDSETAKNYQIIVDRLLADGGGTYTGAIFFESFVEGKTNNGMVTFTVTARGDDALVWADAAA